MKRVLVVVAGLVLMLLALGWATRTTLALRLMERVVARNMATDLLDTLPDGLHVVLCGAGSPLPDPQRSGPCTAIVAGDQLIIVDAGSGASRVMSRVRLPQGEIDAVLLTHFHSDHIDGLGEVLLQRWANGGHREPLPVHGPEGVAQVVEGIDAAYAASRASRTLHHGEAVVPSAGGGGVARPFPVPAEGEGVVVIDADGLVVTAFLVDHSPVRPAVGYHFAYAGRSALVSGDTVKSTNLQKFADGVDLLVHEALAPQLVRPLTMAARAQGNERLAKITVDILDYHTTPVDAAEIAHDAGVGHLLYNHIVPPLPLAPLEEVFVEGVDEVYDGPVTIGRDGTLVQMDANASTIVVRELL